MRIGFYDPYFNSLGGGERYTFTLASHWAKLHDVSLFWDDPTLPATAASRFNLDLTRVKVAPNVFATNKFFAKLAVSRTYDLIFFLSDGSIPTSFAKRNILHFQVPFSVLRLNAFKLSRYQAIVCNSQFTRDHLDSRLRSRTTVIYPPVEAINPVGGRQKRNLILTVGRFSGHHEAKKQTFLIEVFQKLERELKGWEFVLAGGLISSDEPYFRRLVRLGNGHHIRLLPNADFQTLATLYGQAKIYWHAAGFGETDPQLMEHFGISTAEAMSAGAVPVVFAGGGQVEIVKHGINGYLWETPTELTSFTTALIRDASTLRRLSENTREITQKFSGKIFLKRFDDLLDRLS